MYAAADRGAALFASHNGGADWIPLGDQVRRTIIAIAVDPNNPSTIFAGGDGGLWKSIDAGASWTQKPEWQVPVNAIAIDPSDSTVYFSGFLFSRGFFGVSLGGVFRSRDGDEFVQIRAVDPVPYGVIVDPDAPGRVFVVHPQGLLRSDDRGETWERRDHTSNPLSAATALAVQRGYLYALLLDGRVLRSNDLGDSFDPVDGYGTGNNTRVLSVSRDGVTHVGGVLPDDLFVQRFESDGALTYSSYLGTALSDEPYRIAVREADQHLLIVGSTGGLNGFLAELDYSGMWLRWQQYPGEILNSVAAAKGSAYVGRWTDGQWNVTRGPE